MISEPMIRLVQTAHLSCTDTNTVSKWTETRFHMTDVTLEFHQVRPKWEPMEHSAQTVQLSCVKISTISKRTKTSFHKTLVTQEYHRVCPKWFLSPWYVWRKVCTNLAPTLTLSLNRLKRDYTWPTSPRSSIECFKNDFRAYGMSGANRAPILHWH
jgi:hypothetical protein